MITDRTYKKGVLWDIDGTLILSEHLHDEAVIKTLDTMGFKDYLHKLDMLGSTWDRIWASVGGAPDKLVGFEDQVAQYYIDNIKTLEQRSCAVDLVRAFNKAGIVQAAVSNSKACIVHANLEYLGIKDMMKAIVTREDCQYGKPEPEPYIIGAERVELSPRDCVTVEDSPTGAQSGKAAGALSVFWPEKPETQSEYCDYKISDIMDVPWKDILGIDLEI